MEQRTLGAGRRIRHAHRRRPRRRALGRQFTKRDLSLEQTASFEKLPGLARDIGVGGDGSAWIIGTDSGVYKWNGNDWDRMEGQGVAISVDRSGQPVGGQHLS